MANSLARQTRHALAAQRLKPQKGWGQHFLTDISAIRRIVKIADLHPDDVVVEIGSGLGSLSLELARHVAKLYLVEIDRGFVRHLREIFAHMPHVAVIEGDFLRLPSDRYFPEPCVKAVANLPYNIASPVLFKLLEERKKFSHAVLMLQKEMAERLLARPGGKAYGILSVMVQLYADVKKGFRVPPHLFFPRPRVDSLVVSLRFHRTPVVPVADEDLFRRLVKAAFAQRRKTLRNALKGLFSEVLQGASDGQRIWHTVGIDPVCRGETLSLEEFARLANALTDLRK